MLNPRLPERPGRILVVRADKIGDHVLAAGMLPRLKERFPAARITVACPDLVQDLFAACPWVDRVIPFDKRRLHRNPLYRLGLALTLRRLRADLVLNTVYSRDSASDLLCRMAGGVRVGHQGDGHNLRPERRRRNDRIYSYLVPPLAGTATELERNGHFLRNLGLPGGLPGELAPTAWVAPADRTAAAELLARHGLDTLPCLAFFPGTGDPIRFYDGYPEVLGAFLGRVRAGLVCLGGPGDRAWAEALLAGLPGPKANLCGVTRLPQAAAVLERCRLGFGAETGLAHLAAAVGTPHLVLLGGGYFGRFMPTSPLTRAICLPLACYGCAWACPYPRPHCVRDLPPGAVLEALARTWEEPAGGPTLFHCAWDGTGPRAVDPAATGLGGVHWVALDGAGSPGETLP
jgi:ADP-heptose:LPS heptosyltransferase